MEKAGIPAAAANGFALGVGRFFLCFVLILDELPTSEAGFLICLFVGLFWQ